MNRVDAEVAVLSAVMLGEAKATRVFEFLEPRHFCCEAHQTIFEAMVALHEDEKPANVVQVATWLKESDRIDAIGGMTYLAELLNRAPAGGPSTIACARMVQAYWRHPCVTP
jgi:replicative DNA helicase